LVYPNPASKNSSVYFRIITEKNILAIYVSSLAGQLGATMEAYHSIDQNVYEVELKAHDFAN
jgi:hypothetical protein